jgi:hypothetical protein
VDYHFSSLFRKPAPPWSFHGSGLKETEHESFTLTVCSLNIQSANGAAGSNSLPDYSLYTVMVFKLEASLGDAK